MSKKVENKDAHNAVLTLLFMDILSTEQANKLHRKIDKKIKFEEIEYENNN